MASLEPTQATPSATPEPGTLRVALVKHRYRDDGGAERAAARTLAGLAASGMAVTVICREWKAPAAPEGGALVVEACDPAYLGRVGRERSFARAAAAAWQRGTFDLVQCHERIPGCALYRAGDGVHRSWLDQYRRVIGPWHRAWLSLSPFHRYVLQAEKRLFEHPGLRAVICNSDMVRRDIASRFAIPADRLHLIRNGVDTRHFSPRQRETRAARRRELGLAADVPLLLFVGSGFARKGLGAALSALAGAPRAHLLVVGQDRHIARYQRQAQELGIARRVHWLGRVADVAPWYGCGDGLLLPTLYDPFPNAALEAMACGLGVIVSNSCGAAELVTCGVEGEVCDALDVPALTRAIARFEAPARARAMGEAARRRAEPYTLEAMGAALTALYSELLAHP